jgi:hypothetical protein
VHETAAAKTHKTSDLPVGMKLEPLTIKDIQDMQAIVQRHKKDIDAQMPILKNISVLLSVNSPFAVDPDLLYTRSDENASLPSIM